MLNDCEGIDTFRGVPKSGSRINWKGGVPPVHEILMSSHCVGEPAVKEKAWAAGDRVENAMIAQNDLG